MAVQLITIEMPESVYQSAKHAADILKRPINEIIRDTLTATFPILDDVPADMTAEVAAMIYLSDEALQGLASSVMPQEQQNLLHERLDDQNRGQLDETKQRELTTLMALYGRHVLRRAKAMELLIARGRPMPKLEPVAWGV